ncbi:MAG: hypothetical protein J6R35_04560 [Clostridia bacterium]|nr:hypothetical protein [Clostridia bacterium]
MTDRNMMENAPASSMPVDAGRWVAVDQNSLGFSVPPLPNGQPVQGPDGALYCVGKSEDTVMPVAGNANNAIPTPSGIVQLPPIVQPIALVPYTSQNQPLLQYDPYSRPVDPQVAPKAPVYIRKPYKGISIVALILALVGLAALLLLAVVNGGDLAVNGLGAIIGALAVLGLGGEGDWTSLMSALKSDAAIVKIALSIIPFAVLVIAIIFLALVIKYIVKLAQGKSPRSVSVLAIINIILTVLVAVLGLLVYNNVDGGAITDYLLNNDGAKIALGIGVIVALVISILLFILPLCAKKNAYMVEKDPSKESYVIK